MDRQPEDEPNDLPKRRVSLQVVVWAICVLLGVGAVVWLAWPAIHPTAPAPEVVTDNSADDTNLADALTPPSPGDDDARASAAAFDPSGVLKPQKVVPIGAHFAVIAVGEVTDGAHVDSGTLAVQYVDRNGDGFAPFGLRVEAQAGTMGKIGGWTLRRDLGDDPMVALQGGGTWQGCTMSTVQLIALTADGPRIVSDAIPVSFQNDGNGSDEDNDANNAASPGGLYSGTIGNAGMDPAAGAAAADEIEVTYTGSVRQLVRFHRANGRFVPDTPLPAGC